MLFAKIQFCQLTRIFCLPQGDMSFHEAGMILSTYVDDIIAWLN